MRILSAGTFLNDYFSPLPHDEPQAEGLGVTSSPAPQEDGLG